MPATRTPMPAAPIPSCPNCNGTGRDEAFDSDCNCHLFTGTTTLVARSAASSERFHRPGERLDGRTFGSEPKPASIKQVEYLLKLLAERRGRDRAEGLVWAQIEAASDHPMTSRFASQAIDALLAMPRRGGPSAAAGQASPAPQAANVRPNKFAGRCRSCGAEVAAEAGRIEKVNGAWAVYHVGTCPVVTVEEIAEAVHPTNDLDLRTLPSGRYGIPGSDSRLKLQIERGEGRWAGVIFVKDAAVYGHGRNYGRQGTDGRYRGDVVAELKAILADPAAARAKYGALTGQCSCCNRPLEDETSVALGVGPWCRSKYL